MQLAEWVRAAVLRAEDWRGELASLEGDDFDLGCACEEIDPDRSRALAHFMAAWRRDDIQAKGRAIILARELRDHLALAQLAVGDGDHAAAAAAYVDAGMFESAREQLAKAGASTNQAKTLQLIATKTLRDPHRELAQYVARGEWTMAARIAHVAGEPMWGHVLANAHKKAPRDEAVAALVEDRLLARGSAEELLEHYRVRFDAARGGRAWSECVRNAAVDLISRGKQVGLGLRLLRRAIDNALIERVVDLPRFVASIELLVEHARRANTLREVLPIVVDALKLPFEIEERAYLAILGLQIAWRDIKDVEAAKPFAAIVIEHAPRNRLAKAFVAAVMPRLASTPVVQTMPIATIAGSTASPAPKAAMASASTATAASPTAPASTAPSPTAPASTAPASAAAASAAAASASTATASAKAAMASASTATAASPTALASTAPASTAPASTAPASTAPASTAPASTAPASTAPASTAPASTAPASTAPASTAPASPLDAIAAADAAAEAAAAAADPAAPAERPSQSLIPSSILEALRRSGPLAPVVPVAPPREEPTRRVAERRILPIDVSVELPGRELLLSIARDVSTSGLFLITPRSRRIPLGTIVTLDLPLPDPSGLSQTRYRIKAKVARMTELGVGLAFIDPPPEAVAAIDALT